MSDNRERDEQAASPLEEPLAVVGVAIAGVWRILPKWANWQNASGTLAAAAIDAMEAAGYRRTQPAEAARQAARDILEDAYEGIDCAVDERHDRAVDALASAGLLQEPQPAGQQVSIPHHVSYLDANGDPGDCPDDPDRCPGCALEDRLVTAMQASQDRMRAKNLTYPEDEETQLFRLARIVLRELPPARPAVDDDTVERREEFAIRWNHPDANGYISHHASSYAHAKSMLDHHEWAGHGEVVHRTVSTTEWSARAAVRAVSGEGQ